MAATNYANHDVNRVPGLIGQDPSGNPIAIQADTNGYLYVTGSITVGGTTDNSAFTAGTSTGTTAFGFYHSTIDTVTDGRAAAIAIDSKRNQFMVIRDAAGNAQGVNVTTRNSALIEGPTAVNVAIAAAPVTVGGVGQTAEQTVVTSGRVQNVALDLYGKTVTSPYAERSYYVSGTANSASAATFDIIAAAGASLKYYITSITAANTGSTASLISIIDSTPTTLWVGINPAGGGITVSFPTPIATAANVKIQATTGSASTTQYVTVTAYKGA